MSCRGLTKLFPLCTFFEDSLVEVGAMKNVICVCLFAASTFAFAQGSYPLGDDQVRSEMSASEAHSYRSADRADFGITTGYAGFKIDNIAREGVNIDLHALLSRVSPIRIELNAGTVLYNTPFAATGQSSEYLPYIYQSNVYDANQFSQPRSSITFALGYIGSDVLYYFSDGKVRPYVAAGVKAVTWQMSEGFAGTIAPSLRAGIEVAMNSSFSGFAEARYMYGFPNFLNHARDSLLSSERGRRPALAGGRPRLTSRRTASQLAAPRGAGCGGRKTRESGSFYARRRSEPAGRSSTLPEWRWIFSTSTSISSPRRQRPPRRPSSAVPSRSSWKQSLPRRRAGNGPLEHLAEAREQPRPDQTGDLGGEALLRAFGLAAGPSSADAGHFLVGLELDLGGLGRSVAEACFGDLGVEIAGLARRRPGRSPRNRARVGRNDVGVAADGRGEVAVGPAGEARVTEVARVVAGLLERAQDKRREGLLI